MEGEPLRALLEKIDQACGVARRSRRSHVGGQWSAATVVCIRLYDKHWPPESGLGMARLREVRPPNLAPLQRCGHLPGVRADGFKLRLLQRGIEFRVLARIPFVQTRRDVLALLPSEELS